MSDVGKLVELIKEEGLLILPEVYSGKQWKVCIEMWGFKK